MGNIKRMYCLLWTHKFKKALKKTKQKRMFSKSFTLFVINWNLQNKIAALLQMDMTQTYRDQNWPWWNIKLDIWEICPQSLDDPSGAPLLDFLAAWPKRRTALTYSEIFVFLEFVEYTTYDGRRYYFFSLFFFKVSLKYLTLLHFR